MTPTSARGGAVEFTPDFAHGRSLPWLMSTWATLRPDHPYVVWEPFEGEGRVWTYAEFWRDSCRLMSGLRARGVRAGDRVLVHTDNCPEFLLSWWALTSMGAVAVCTNTKSSLDEMTYFASHSESVAAITQPRFAEIVGKAMPSAPWIAVTDTDSGEAPATGSAPTGDARFASLLADGDTTPPAPNPLAHGSIQYTSGTTSRPKAVVWTHANCLWAGKVSSDHEGIGGETVTLLHLPLFHTNAMSYSMLSTTWVGGTIVLMPKFSASRFWDVAVRNRATFTAVIQFCIKALATQPMPERHSLKLIGNGSAVPAAEERFRTPVMGWYGMTETVSHPVIGERLLPNRPGSCGRAASEYGVRIVREDGTPVEAGETGSLLIHGRRGRSLFAEYLHDPEATAAAFDEHGWLVTGDRVTLHEDGFITFADRDKDMLKVGAENVAASEIERVIATVPGVFEVAVVAARHPMLDEVPVAFVIPSGAADRASLAVTVDAACRERLASFKVPAQIRIVDTLPRSTLEKVAKAELRRQLREEDSR